MVEPAGEFLENRLIAGTRPTAAEIAADDLHLFPQRPQRPDEIVAGEAAVLPIREGLAGGETIHVDGDVDLVVVMVVQPIHKQGFPVSYPQWIEVGGITNAPLPPGINNESMGLGRAPIAEKPPRKVALETAATPDADAFDAGIFQRAIDPRAARPIRRADVPVGMIVEREEGERLVKLPLPDGAQVVEIAGTKKGEGTKFGGVFLRKGIDPRGGGDKPKRLGFLAYIDDRQTGLSFFGNEIPSVIRLEKNLISRNHHWKFGI